MMANRLQRRVLITGVTRGIGASLAERLIGLNHTVYGCGRSASIIQELQIKYAGSHRFQALDVAEGSEVHAWAEDLLQEAEPPDLIVNNAGVMNRPAPLWEVAEEEFNNLLRINVVGMANVLRAFLPAMIARGAGIIVNMSSGWGRSTAPEVGPYCASKWAIEGMTLSLSQELPDGLAAVAVNPGIINTEMLRSCWGESAESFPSPDEWAERASPFLLSLSKSDNGSSLSAP
jgi:NAD(P)-dependent dehydrogenase (short-subunit alcohol dehydrogenase family)